MTRIGIIRHGRTSWNNAGRAQGNTDIPLDDEGISMAYKLADRLSQENWDAVYSSNLLRAKQTAEIISKKLKDIPVQWDVRLREVGRGQIEGTTESERIKKWGDNWRKLNLGIESTDQVTTRGISLLEEIITQSTATNILIVTHGLFTRHILKILVPNINMDEHIKNTSLTTLLKTSRGWNCEMYNCTKHLEVKEI
ncbi:histidine phosphatase family protein [Paenibacillus crassostreae]|uniref:Phosphoglycerate kinase n=1 Tax=Paenibacillus crassostreae TaxID=1763538 RepID=A0A167FZU5_9BACL|nr:histidine phosphatase family protein [Paenibacillus crassostreae]AOZ93904.1 histidine phosphatase family protein [Paenibacillus crassostreae]OAB77064.1 phosphoglycerate kinase [Paenibacillus crassostreae]